MAPSARRAWGLWLLCTRTAKEDFSFPFLECFFTISVQSWPWKHAPCQMFFCQTIYLFSSKGIVSKIPTNTQERYLELSTKRPFFLPSPFLKVHTCINFFFFWLIGLGFPLTQNLMISIKYESVKLKWSTESIFSLLDKQRGNTYTARTGQRELYI